jgi:membrane-bound serine protease (ClpP class)
MAPGTTVGAAHPVDVGGEDIPADARAKATSFAASMIQSIAEQRGRNTEWAARAVRESIAATAQEALDQNVIDLLADDVNDLMKKMDGMVVETAAGEITLHTRRAGMVPIDMSLPEQFFHTLVNPNVAFVLLSLGLLAISVELYHPGATVPAIVGGICLILAFVALGNLPVNWGGAILIVASVILFIVDVKVNSLALTIGGLVTFILGGFLLFRPFALPSPVLPRVSVSPVVVFTLAGILGAFFVFALGAAVRGRNYPVISGREALIGTTLRAEGDRQARILAAEGYALALETIFGTAKGIDAKTMSLQYLDALKALGGGPATKFIFPMEFTHLLRPFVEYAGESVAQPAGQGEAEQG